MEIRYQSRAATFHQLIGFRFIQELLRRPGEEVFAGELYSAATGKPTDWNSVSDTLVDNQALREYRRELADKEAELSCLSANRDDAYRNDLLRDIEHITKEIQRVSGLGGKLRRTADDREKARKRVSEALTRAFKKLGPHLPALENHLRGAIRQGEYVCYNPAPLLSPAKYPDTFWMFGRLSMYGCKERRAAGFRGAGEAPLQCHQDDRARAQPVRDGATVGRGATDG